MQPCEEDGPWTAESLFALLHDPRAVEWRERVGVAGASDGSARDTTRLLAVGGTVLKLRLDQGHADPVELLRQIDALRARWAGKGLWHPDKRWALLRAGPTWYALTLCPELRTLRRIEGRAQRMAAWTRMLVLGLEVHERWGVGLDLNPSNFGLTDDDALYYLDDDLYSGLELANLAGALAARISEEGARVSPAEWATFGAAVARAIPLPQVRRLGLIDEVQRYPLAELFHEHRAALIAGLSPPEARGARRPGPRVTALLADVHGNLPALEAVIDDARRRGADSWLFLGDAVGYGPFPGECVDRLAGLAGAQHVKGNHDHAVATGDAAVGMNRLARSVFEWTRRRLGPDQLAWLRELPVELEGEGWRAVHGAPRDPARFLAYVYELTYEDNLRHLREQGVPLCFYGHTHVQTVQADLPLGPAKLPGPRSFFPGTARAALVNPGSVGQPRDGDPRAAYALWDRQGGEVLGLRVDYDVERTARAMVAFGHPAELCERLRRGQ